MNDIKLNENKAFKNTVKRKMKNDENEDNSKMAAINIPNLEFFLS